MNFMKASIAALFIWLIASPASALTCYEGKFEIRGFKGTAAKYSFRLDSTNSKKVLFVSNVLNPDEIIVGGDSKEFAVKEIFRPDKLDLVLLEGIRCPCTALQSRDGQLQIIIEELGDRSTRTQIEYFGFKASGVEMATCR
jgi:hypothetical protein